MMLKRLKSLLVFLVAVTVCMGTIPVSAADTSARTVTVSQVDGTVTMTKGAVKQFNAKTGQKLLDGYTVTTGKGAECYLNLDDASVVVMDQNSKVEISQASSRLLSVTVLSGNISVSAAKQKAGQAIEVSAGNSTMAIRGTLFTYGFMANGNLLINMIEGSGDVDGMMLLAGESMAVTLPVPKASAKAGEQTSAGGQTSSGYTKAPLTLDANSSPFLLKTVIDNKDKALGSGLYNDVQFDSLQTILESKVGAQSKVNGQAAQPTGKPSSSSNNSSNSNSSNNNNNSTATPKPTPTPTPTPAPTETPTATPTPVPEEIEYTLVFNSQGGVIIYEGQTYSPKLSVTLKEGQTLGGALPTAEHNNDKKYFIGWNTAANGKGTAFDGGTAVGENLAANNDGSKVNTIELWAVWGDKSPTEEPTTPPTEEPTTPPTEEPTVTLTLVRNYTSKDINENMSLTTPLTVTEDAPAKLPNPKNVYGWSVNENPSSNFIFWNTQSDGKGQTYYAGDELTYDKLSSNEQLTTLYAIWDSAYVYFMDGNKLIYDTPFILYCNSNFPLPNGDKFIRNEDANTGWYIAPEGKEFAGWSATEGSTTADVVLNSNGEFAWATVKDENDGDLNYSLYAVWKDIDETTPQSVDVTLVQNQGDSVTETLTVTEDIAKALPNPKTAYNWGDSNQSDDFISWNTQSDGKGTVYNVGDKLTYEKLSSSEQSQTLYAIWKDATPKTANVTLVRNYANDTNPGAVAETLTVTDAEDDSLALPNPKTEYSWGDPNRRDDFISWNTQSDGTGTSYGVDRNFTYEELSASEQPFTLYAIWKDATPKTANVTLVRNYADDVNQGAVTETLTVTDAEDDSLALPNPKTAYSWGDPNQSDDFISWNMQADGKGTSYGVDHNFTYEGVSASEQPFTLYAIWKDKTSKTADVTLVRNYSDADVHHGNSTTELLTITEGTPTALPNPKTEYNDWGDQGGDFISWNTQADGKGVAYNADDEFNYEDVITGEQPSILYAIWDSAFVYFMDGENTIYKTPWILYGNSYLKLPIGDDFILNEDENKGWYKAPEGKEFAGWSATKDSATADVVLDPSNGEFAWATVRDENDGDLNYSLYAVWQDIEDTTQQSVTVTLVRNFTEKDVHEDSSLTTTLTVTDATSTKLPNPKDTYNWSVSENPNFSNFISWNTQADGKGVAYNVDDEFNYEDVSTGEQPAILYAIWDSAFVYFMDGKATVYGNPFILYGNSYLKLPIGAEFIKTESSGWYKAPEGKTFIGWSATEGSTTADVVLDPSNGEFAWTTVRDEHDGDLNYSLYAVWQDTVQESHTPATVSFNANFRNMKSARGGLFNPSKKIEYGDAIELPGVDVLGSSWQSMAGDRFLGWNHVPDNSDESTFYKAGDTLDWATVNEKGDNLNYALYAIWGDKSNDEEDSQESATYSVNYYENSGDSISGDPSKSAFRKFENISTKKSHTVRAFDDSKLGFSVPVGKTLSDFLGWASDPSATEPVHQPNEEINGAAYETIHLYAVWAYTSEEDDSIPEDANPVTEDDVLITEDTDLITVDNELTIEDANPITDATPAVDAEPEDE